MKEITHTFKIGDTIDCSGLSMDDRKAIIKKAIADGAVEINHNIDVVNICSPFLHISEKRKVDFWRFPRDHTLTWDDITKTIKPETPWFPRINETCFVSLLDEHNWAKGRVTGALGELIYFETEGGVEVLKEKEIKFKPINSVESTLVDEAEDKPYTPKSGEIFEVDMGDYLAKALYIGVDYKDRHTYQFVEGDIEGKVYYDKNTDLFHPIKTEREKLVEKACEASENGRSKEFNVNIDCSAYGRYIIEDLIDAGWRPPK